MDNKAYIDEMSYQDDAVTIQGSTTDCVDIHIENVTITANHEGVKLAGDFLKTWSFAKSYDNKRRVQMLYADKNGNAPRVFIDAICARLAGDLYIVEKTTD